MNKKTLVKITAESSALMVRTISRDRKSPHAFCIPVSVFARLNAGCTKTVSCCRSFAELRCSSSGKQLYLRFTWLSGSDKQLSGWTETVAVSYRQLIDFISSGAAGDAWSTLSLECSETPRYIFHSRKNLHAVAENCIVRRKLARFLRDNFRWPGSDTIQFYDDFVPYSFFFRETRAGERGICGGVILHGQEDLKTAHYSIHT